jgi:hypothetical protein
MPIRQARCRVAEGASAGTRSPPSRANLRGHPRERAHFKRGVWANHCGRTMETRGLPPTRSKLSYHAADQDDHEHDDLNSQEVRPCDLGEQLLVASRDAAGRFGGIGMALEVMDRAGNDVIDGRRPGDIADERLLRAAGSCRVTCYTRRLRAMESRSTKNRVPDTRRRRQAGHGIERSAGEPRLFVHIEQHLRQRSGKL